MKKIVILGAMGQDGSYLIDKIHDKNELYCLVKSRKDKTAYSRLEQKGCKIFEFDENKSLIDDIIKNNNPDVICNFAAVSNVFSPWDNPEEITKTNLGIPAKILNSISKYNPEIHYIQASSSLVFGLGSTEYCDEETERNPIFHYGVSKNAADQLIKNYRMSGLCPNACSMIFFNHESPRRGENFFTKKVARAALDFSIGKRKDKLTLGNLDAVRDMSDARDFINAISIVIEKSDNQDYVLGSGKFVSMRDFIRESFEYFNLDYRDFVIEDKKAIRKFDTRPVRANTMKIEKNLGWKAESFKASSIIEGILGE